MGTATTKTLVAINAAMLLASCGGGGSGGGGGGGSTAPFRLESPVLAGNFSFYRGNVTAPVGNPVHYLYPVDLNGDGIDEVLFAGFETQPNTPTDYSNTSVHIFGWVGNAFTDITSTWLPGGIHEVEAVGDVAFGDFDNNGYIDAYLSANADMDPDMAYTTNAYALMNNGTAFTRVNLGPNAWEHGVAAGDINGDNYDDVVVGGYQQPSVFLMGSAAGLVKFEIQAQDATDYMFNNYETHASGVAIGDFLANGTLSVAVVDSAAHGGNNAVTTVVENMMGDVVGFKHASDLPAPILAASHDVRIRGFNFDSDMDEDIIVFSREDWNGSQWPVNSRVQFLRNDGGGNFTDVTSTILVDYDTNSNVAYNPLFADFNGDGRTDIFMGEVDFRSTTNSTTFLLQQEDGSFVDTGRSTLSTRVLNGGLATVARGPGGFYYLISDATVVMPDSAQTYVYSSRISWP